MMASDPNRSSVFADSLERDDFTADRIRWLISLRWVAMAGVLAATLFAAAGYFPGVAWPVCLAVVVAGSAYNYLLLRRVPGPGTGQRAAVSQALVDLVLLTIVLWAAGGISSPFIAFYVFHLALIGILGGPGATLIATAAALAGAGFLAFTEWYPALQIGTWNPKPPWDTIADVAAFVTTVGAVAYVVLHAVRELRDRERALSRARDQSELEYQVISNTLDELHAGLEVVSADGHIEWRNRLADELAPTPTKDGTWECPVSVRRCETTPAGLCPVWRALDEGSEGRCRFSVGDRWFEMLSFPLASRGSDEPRIMNLYVDRTEILLAERRLLHAERLASLGRVAQGVAHELNTPLATIRTLAADMGEAIKQIQVESAFRSDLAESAALIRDETGRLGQITHSLLTGGTLPRLRLDSSARLLPIVERARALVFAGSREGGPELELGENLGQAVVAADPDRLLQVLVNLLQNAVDANREVGGRMVWLSAERRGSLIHILVDDEGGGLDPAMEGRLFEPFATTKPPGEGTGLGLYASYMLVQTMGGDLTIENREPCGVRARIKLPAGLAKATGVHQRAH
ncbi:MAG: ATP-binding protein [Myxococcales bacterium]|jgi:signal transduction histidine kinase